MEVPGSGSGSGAGGGGAALGELELSTLPLPVGRTARGRGGATVGDLRPRAPTDPALSQPCTQQGASFPAGPERGPGRRGP